MSDPEVQGNNDQHVAIMFALDPSLAAAESQKQPLPNSQPSPRRDVRRISIQVSAQRTTKQTGGAGMSAYPCPYPRCPAQHRHYGCG
jgi:hypothetical protein